MFTSLLTVETILKFSENEQQKAKKIFDTVQCLSARIESYSDERASWLEHDENHLLDS